MAAASQPRHAAIAKALREQMRSGELSPGSPLPSEAQLSRRFDVSRGTVRQALAALRAEGLIAVSRGRVPVVRRAGLSQNFDEVVSFTMWARQLGRAPSARTLAGAEDAGGRRSGVAGPAPRRGGGDRGIGVRVAGAGPR